MASLINAITSAGGGLALTPDSSGVLAFQSAGTTYMTMDTGGNLKLTSGNIYWDVSGTRYIANTGDSSSNITLQGLSLIHI